MTVWSFIGFAGDLFGSNVFRLEIVDVLRIEDTSDCEVDFVEELEVCLVEKGMLAKLIVDVIEASE